MSSDLFALNALAQELDENLRGARVDKIQQPESDELRLFLRASGKNVCLCMSCNAAAPRIHLTTNRKQSPQSAPTLCMLLRKHLTNANIESISVYNCDRILQIKFNAHTEMRDEADFYIFIEIMNRYSNIVFTDANLIILDAVKHLPFNIERNHVVMRGVPYIPVAQPKTSYLNDCTSIIDAYEGGDLHKYILDNISGFSGITASELMLKAGLDGNCTKLNENQKQDLLSAILQFGNIRTADYYSPCIINNKDVYPFAYSALCNADKSNVVRYDEMSQAYDALYTDCDGEIRNKARLKHIATAAKRLHSKVEKNIATDMEKLRDCNQMDTYRLYGELIVSNIYKLNKGDKVLKCTNYYDGSEVEITLDERLTPSKNSAAYYTKYNKLKRTQEFVSKKLIADENLLEYIKSIEEEIANLPFNADIAPIEEELAMLGAGKKKSSKGKVRKEKPEPPFIYLCDEFYIYCGKNNLQNDELTFKFASSSDIWMHLKNAHGAHTIIIAEGRTVPDKILTLAAEITASTQAASAEVDYTERRNVKRKPNGHPGQTLYVNYKTILASPDKHEEFLIKK